MAHTAQYHTFIRCEGNTLLRKLPEEARLSLRYFEVVGFLNSFKPYPPLSSSKRVIKGKKYYYIAVTDWSLFLLTKDNKVEGSVLLEVPWLGIRMLVSALALSRTDPAPRSLAVLFRQSPPGSSRVGIKLLQCHNVPKLTRPYPWAMHRRKQTRTRTTL